MADEIARLGLSIDTRQATAAAGELNKLVPAASAAEKAFGTLEKAGSRAAEGHRGLSTQAMAATHSLRSMFEGMALGMPIQQVLLQQMNHLSYAATGPGGLKQAFAESASMLRGMITPATLLVGGIGALTGAAFLAYSSWKSFALQLDDTARQAGTTTLEMSKLQAAASFKGISGKSFDESMGKFSEQIYQARTNAGSLFQLFQANGAKVTDFQSTFSKVADLIQNASSDQQRLNLLQQAGLPATMQWVRFMQDGAAGIKKAKDEAAAFGGTVNDEMVNKARAFDEAWDKALTNFSRGFKSQIIENTSLLGDLITKAAEFSVRVGQAGARLVGIKINPLAGGTQLTADTAAQFYNATGAGRSAVSAVNTNPNAGTVDPEQQKRLLTLEQQRLALLGPLASATQVVRQKEIELQLAYLNSGVSVGKYADALKRLAEFQSEAGKLSRQNQFGIFDQSRQARNAGLEMRTLIDDKTVSNAEQYGAAWTVIQKNLRNASESAAVARSNFEGLTRFGLDAANFSKQFDQTAVAALNDIENGLIDFASSTKTAKDAFRDMTVAIIKDVERMVIRMGITGPLASGLASLFPGSGGFYGGNPTTNPNLVPIGQNHTGYGPGDSFPVRLVNASVLNRAPRFHGGVGPGERAAVIRNDESVLTPGQMRALGARSGNSITIAPVINVSGGGGNGADNAKLATVIAAQVKAVAQDTIRQELRYGGALNSR